VNRGGEKNGADSPASHGGGILGPSLFLMLLEIALGPFLWILFGSTVVAVAAAILVAVMKRGWPFAIAAGALPFFVASSGAALELHYLEDIILEEGSGFAAVAPAVARALMLSMLGFAATLAPAIPAAMSAQKGPLWRWPLLPLCLVPIFAIAQVPFGYPATALIRLVPYLGVAGVLAKRGASLAILLPVVAAGECAALAVAYVDLFTAFAMSASIEMVAVTSREISAGRWFGVASFVALIAAQLLAKHWKSLLLLGPLCAAAAYAADATERVVELIR
jgi:hypothetical protein